MNKSVFNIFCLDTGTWHQPGEEYNAAKVHEDIKYTKADDEAIDNWVSDHVETTWHSLGTCAMKPRERGGVVDKRLSVYGTENLKCVDLSICPVSHHDSLIIFLGVCKLLMIVWSRTT